VSDAAEPAATKAAKVLRFSALWNGSNWVEPAYVSLDKSGCLASLSDRRPAGADDVEEINGYAIPGFQNAHSHAFQYAMAGLAENQPPGSVDDFWSWREAMYALALKITPEQMECVAAMAYAEMVRHGYTAVVEFHYLHHDPDGRPYKKTSEMGERLMVAAEAAGIHLTLAPVLYRQGGFNKEPSAPQRRFVSPSLTAFEALRASTRAAAKGRQDVTVAAAAHSVRAVAGEELEEWLKLAPASGDGPIHIHVSEQRREVEESIANLGQRPVAWVLQRAADSKRLALVHATHIDDAEIQALVQSRATVVVCPSTEGNLGDGLFPLLAYAAAGGKGVAIGTDSHVGLNPLEELRWLDYGQRLKVEQRNPLLRLDGGDSGVVLFGGATSAGRAARGELADPFAVGQPFDVVVADPDHPTMISKPPARRLSALIFSGDTGNYLGVMRRGSWLVERGRHKRYDAIRSRYRSTIAALTR
jgi:formimidoylglutamate deiminase